VKSNWRRLILVAGVSIGLNSTTLVLAIFVLSYATAEAPEGLGLPRTEIVWGSIAGLVLHGVANVIAALLSDRIGRWPVLIGGALASIAAVLTIFHLAQLGTVTSVNIGLMIGFTATGFLFGPCTRTSLSCSRRNSSDRNEYRLPRRRSSRWRYRRWSPTVLSRSLEMRRTSATTLRARSLFPSSACAFYPKLLRFVWPHVERPLRQLLYAGIDIRVGGVVRQAVSYGWRSIFR
jgi:MFS family permease